MRQAYPNRNGVAQRQRDDADRHERGEGRCAAQVDQAEQHLHDGEQEERPDGHAEARGDARPEGGAGDGVVAGDGPGAARCGVGDADGAEERDGEDEEDEAEAAAWRSHDAVEDVRQRLRVRRLEDVGERRQREADGQDEEDTEEASNRDTVDP